MPVKKPIKKKKKPSKKKVAPAKKKKLEKDIKQAVDKIPGLFFEHVDFAPAPATKTPITTSQPNQINTDYQVIQGKKRLLLWLGVIGLTVVVFVLWIWNTKTFFTDIRQQKNVLLEQTKNDWENVTDEQYDQFQKLLDKKNNPTEISNNDDKIKQELIKALINLSVSTTTDNNTTTTISN